MQAISEHKPYPPTTAGLGGMPNIDVDDPITAVFIFLFLLGAITHMTILQVNLRRGKKFFMSGMLFGFCMARIVACSMRLAWSTHHDNISVAIAAQVFVSIGVILLFIVNLIFAQRILRASHPHIGWAKWFSWAFKAFYASIIIVIIALVTCSVQSFYTRSHNTLRIDRDVVRFGGTYFAVAAFLPIVLLVLGGVIPRRSGTEKFGHGHFSTKIIILVCSSLLLTLGAAFRAGIAYAPRPINDPAWYHSKACFYIFNFTIECIVVALYAIIRVDKRFIVPNNSHGPGDYSGQGDGAGHQKSSVYRVKSEEEVFDDQPEDDEVSSPAVNNEDDLEAQHTVETASHT